MHDHHRGESQAGDPIDRRKHRREEGDYGNGVKRSPRRRRHEKMEKEILNNMNLGCNEPCTVVKGEVGGPIL
jgi:hypothetical protein